jgi:hypothetical protein
MKNVYQLIAAVSAEIAKRGITKDRNNQAQGYKFRGIDDVYNALSPVMSAAGLVILPRITAREVSERKNQKGSILFYVTVEAEFDFVSSHDGSKHTVKTYGEAMDSGDKATNKAMSAAYKYAAFQTFCIPTEGDNDADAHTHVVAYESPAFDVIAALDAVEASTSLSMLESAWKKYGAIAVDAQDKAGHATLKAAVKEKKATFEEVAA